MRSQKGFSKIWYERKHSLKNAAFFARYICHDIYALIRSSKFHNELKEADIVPLHKKQSKFSKENNRPKVFSHIFSKFTEDAYINKYQISSKMFSWSISAVFARQCLLFIIEKWKKNCGLWRCLWCIIDKLI